MSFIDHPKWLNEEYFRNILSEGGEDVEIVKLTLEPANKTGENYSSLMLRASLEIKSERNSFNRNYIIKLDPEGVTQEIMTQFSVFPKEIEMYNTILPAFRRLFVEIGEDVKFSPRCLKTCCDSPGSNIIIMEDLCTLGFRTANRQLGLDINHAKLALEMLAKFHAASVVFYDQVKAFSGHFQYGLYADHMKPILYEVYKKNIPMMREISSSWNCSESMARFLDSYKTKMLDRVFELISDYRDDGDRFKVLCHGDFWSNNVMFKYDSTTDLPSECVIIDFQLTNFNSPAFDLNYFVFTSLHKDIKLTHMDEFIRHYHTHLGNSLRRLMYSGRIPSLIELHKDYQELAPFGLNSTYGTLCAVVAPPGKDADMNSLLGDDEESKSFRRNLFSNPSYVEALEQLIPYFENKGVF